MKKIIVLICSIASLLTAQEIEDTTIYSFVEQMPFYKGGDEAIMRHLAMSIRYPARAQENNIQGNTIVEFIVEKSGALSNIAIIKSPDSSLSIESKRVVGLMKDWKPGKQGGKPVRVKYNIPVSFRLE